MAQSVTPMDCFQMFSTSNLDRDSDYSEGQIRIFPQFLQASIRIILYIKQGETFHIFRNLFIISTPTSHKLNQ